MSENAGITRRGLAATGVAGAFATACASAEASRRPQVVIAFERGLVIGALRPDRAPRHVAHFSALAARRFYDNLTIVRVAPGHVVQGGDPLFNGEGGSGQMVPAEFNDLLHVRGAIGMARDEDPNSADCQFYICLADRPHLNGRYTLFGQVSEGMEIVDAFPAGDLEYGFISERARQPRILALRVFA